ncbi:MAG TPA: hypothetical protein PK400_10190 [Phycisphaerales bacterium]|nr:hypothetical protein [Phycisphaerales bacterium]
MANYDPQILQQFANLLYRKALTIIVVFTVLGVLIGLIVAGLIGRPLAEVIGIAESAIVVQAVFVIVAGYIGLAIGRAIAFWYKLWAQTVLCQKEIEANTRQIATAQQRPASAVT